MALQPFGHTKTHWMYNINGQIAWYMHYSSIKLFLKKRVLTQRPMFVPQVDKVVQMFETMLTRHTTMVVGPTGGGKSVVINALCQAQTK